MSTHHSSSSSHNSFTLKNANSSVIELISGEQAIQQIRKKDDFVNNLSSFDLHSRTHSPSASLEDYFDFVAKHILPWDEAFVQCMTSTIDNINTTCLDRLKLLTFPSPMFVILTDGKDENDAAYCRNENVIIIPQVMIRSGQIRTVLVHELFHIWSKWTPNLGIRDEIYASIGYNKIPVETPLKFPADLYPMKITNPDAPIVMRYYINLKKQNDETGKTYKCTPILHASQPFDVDVSTSFFHYLVATTLILDDETYEPLQPLEYLPYNEASNFFDQIGNNTEYIIHPEEISAENFVLWMISANNPEQLKTPAIVNNMNDIISAAAGNA
jgi:hypothetical protein